MSKMLDALKQIQQQPESRAPAESADNALPDDGSNLSGQVKELSTTNSDMGEHEPLLDPSSHRHVEDRITAYMEATKPPAERENKAVTELERQVFAHMEQENLREQVLGLAKKIEADSKGKAASLSFHSCEAEQNSLLLVSQLAVVLGARSGERVLLIDADRKGHLLTKAFNAQAEPGLIEVFNATKSWRQAVRATSLPSIGLLAAGRGALADDLPAIGRFTNIVEQMLLDARYVLVYGGEVNREFLAYEPRNFVGSYLILQLGQSLQAEAQAAIEKLQSKSFGITGCVVTGRTKL